MADAREGGARQRGLTAGVQPVTGSHALAAGETELRGARASGVTGDPDEVETRIQWLVAHVLEPVGSASDGWDWLFRDPRDGRFWEQTYPLGSLHGPGPRRLAVIAPDAARAKYGVDACRPT